CGALTKQRVHRGAATPDLFHYLNHDDNPSRPPPAQEQLIEDGILAMVAGSDTVASALTSLFACLVAHPAVYARLQAEVDAHYPRDTDATATRAHRDMAYLGAAINETLRLFPPVPSGTQRQTAPGGPGFTVGDKYIPPGTALWVHVWSMQRDARSFSEPARFWPERWLVDAHDSKASGFVHDEAAFNPFSYGPLNCVGKALGLQEIRTVACAVLQRFEVRRVVGGEGVRGAERWMAAYEGEYRDRFVSVRGKVRVVLEAR
ncbi:cytochrome P450, partial [Epithele typhae]|uniref:cytochrome P450 n=1 Tax=Epithele typhae TaxID=378194 RepID=UPI0020081FBB